MNAFDARRDAAKVSPLLRRRHRNVGAASVLFIGVDLGRTGGADSPDPELTSAVINGLRDRRVLIGAAGRYGHTLKIRPPLCLSRDEADLFVDALADTLAGLAPS